MKTIKYIIIVLLFAIVYIICCPSSCITWFANRTSLYLIRHNGTEINILKNPGNATTAEYLQLEINGRIKENRKLKGEIGEIVVNDSTITIYMKPADVIGKNYIDTITYIYDNSAFTH